MPTIREQVSNLLNFSSDPVSLDEELYASSKIEPKDLELDSRISDINGWRYNINLSKKNEADKIQVLTLCLNELKDEIAKHLQVPQADHRRYDELVDKHLLNELSSAEEQELTVLAQRLMAI